MDINAIGRMGGEPVEAERFTGHERCAPEILIKICVHNTSPRECGESCLFHKKDFPAVDQSVCVLSTRPIKLKASHSCKGIIYRWHRRKNCIDVFGVENHWDAISYGILRLPNSRQHQQEI